MRKIQIGVVTLFALLLLIAFIGIAYGDTGVPAVPEIQGLATGTGMNVQGTVTETDSGAWTLTNDPSVLYIWTDASGINVANAFTGISPANIKVAFAQLQAAGGSAVYTINGPQIIVTQINIPPSLLNQVIAGDPNPITWQQLMDMGQQLNPSLLGPFISGNGIHSGVLDPGQVQYTAGYNDQYSGISGQQTFTKSLALSTGNKIPDQNNINADTNIQFIAVDTGRATRTEDILLDGAAQAQNSSGLILCPFANANQGIIPAFCNIEQAGSSFDTTLTSTVTSADTRFVGTDATIPVVLNYNINAQGITLGDQSSPMIGSVSAYLKVHVQEARNESTLTGTASGTIPGVGLETIFYSFPDAVDPIKSEDLAYSETSTASGLISRFSKSMSYSSQASAVQAPPTHLVVTITPD